jgi:uncharacterized membrane protein
MAESRKTLLRDETFAAIVAAGIVACQWWIMTDLRIPAKWYVVVLGAVLIVALLFMQLLRAQEDRARRGVRVGLVLLLIVANCLNLVALTAQALFDAPSGAAELLFTGIVLWTMNVLVFGMLYWAIDGGGPEARAGADATEPDWAFPQESDARTAPSAWRPMFGDYLYLGFTGAIAFGPTDAMPYTRRAKAAMAVEGALALAILGVIIARGVSLAGS